MASARCSVAAFALLALLTGLSVSWSVAPDESWIEANRTLTYLFVFTAAVAAGNLLPGSLRAVLAGVTLAALAIVAYALASRVWPESLGELEFYARLGQPFGYWNAVGVTAAMGLLGTVWFGSQRAVAPLFAALAAPAAALLIVALFLTYSRSALVAAVIALALWLLVPLRLRSRWIAAGVVGAVPVIAWALSQDAFTRDGADAVGPLRRGPTFGLLLLLAIGLAYGACLAASRGGSATRSPVPPGARGPRNRGRGRLHAARRARRRRCDDGAGARRHHLRPLRGADRRLRGNRSAAPDDSARPRRRAAATGAPRSTPSRTTRPRVRARASHTVTSLRYRETEHVSRHAHGYFVQTLADLGLIGLLASLVALGAWLFAALRAIGATPRSTIGQRFLLGDRRVNHSRAPSWTDERIAVTALFLVTLAYGLQSAADWTWFVPGPTAMAHGRRRLRRGAPATALPGRPARCRDRVAARAVAHRRRGGRAGRHAPVRVEQLAAGRADDLANDALALAAEGDTDAAPEQGRRRARREPILGEAALGASDRAHLRAGRLEQAHAALELAAAEHPNLAQAWLRLADFRLDRLDDPDGAVAAVEPALYLDPQSAAVRQSFIDIRDRFRALGELPSDTAPELPSE